MNNQIGNNIKKYRVKKSLTQSQLGKIINKSLRMVQKYESGDVTPSLDVISKIAYVLDTTIAYLMNIDEEDYETISDIADEMNVPNEYIYGKTKERNYKKYNLKSTLGIINYEDLISTIENYPIDVKNSIYELWKGSLYNILPLWSIETNTAANGKEIDVLYINNMFSKYYSEFEGELHSLLTVVTDENKFLYRKVTSNDMPLILDKRTIFLNKISFLIDKCIIRSLSNEDKILFEREIINSDIKKYYSQKK